MKSTHQSRCIPSVSAISAISLQKNSYRSSVIKAAAALQTLSDRYRLKRARVGKKTGNA